MAHTLHQRQYLRNLSQGPNPNEHLWVFYGMILTHCTQPRVGGTHSMSLLSKTYFAPLGRGKTPAGGTAERALAR